MVSGVTNIEDQTDDKNTRIAAFDKATQESLNNKACIIVEGGKGEPKYWSEHPFNYNPDFQEEFDYIVSNKEVAEADDDFLSDVYDDTYLHM